MTRNSPKSHPKGRHEVTQPQDPTIRLIPLTCNRSAIVDADDYEFLMQWNWYALWSRGTQTFYAVRGVKNNKGRTIPFPMHRAVMPCEPGFVNDHINGDTLDNRKSNLRCATNSENLCNRRLQSNNTSGFRGVGWVKKDKRWRARLKVDGQEIVLGYFKTAEEAAKAYDEGARKVYGEFARLNFGGGGGGGF